MAVRCAQKVHNIAGPTAHIGVVHATVVVIGDIHGAEHMAKVHGIAIGQSEILNILQTGDLQQIFFVFDLGINAVHHFADKCCKISIFVACHNAPGAGVIAVYAGTNILDDQLQRILAGMLLHIDISQFFQQCKIRDKVLIIVNYRLIQFRNFLVAFLVSANGALLIRVPANIGVGRFLCLYINHGMAGGIQNCPC